MPVAAGTSLGSSRTRYLADPHHLAAEVCLETLYLYTGLRQKGARRLLVSTCTRIEDIEIIVIGGSVQVFIEGGSLSVLEREEFAVSDGFANWDDMKDFWAKRMPFSGDIIHWSYPSQEVAHG